MINGYWSGGRLNYQSGIDANGTANPIEFAHTKVIVDVAGVDVIVQADMDSVYRG